MLAAQSAAHQLLLQPRSGRKALQPKNSSPTPFHPKPKAKANVSPAQWAEVDGNDKENVPPIPYSSPLKKEMESFDASLAEELSAIRKKLERLRIDKEKTEKMLRERGIALDSQVKEIIDRGVLQKQLEIEVDRLFRLKEIKLSCTSVSPIRSLREKEQAKKICAEEQQQLQRKAQTHKDDAKEESQPLANNF